MIKKLSVKNKSTSVAVQILNQLKSLLRKQGLLFLDIGRLLKIIRDEKYYLHLGHEKWLDFINSGEVTIKQSTIYAYISIYEMYVMKYGFLPLELAEIPWDKLHRVLPAVRKSKNKDEVEEWVEKAKVLSRSDLAIEVGEAEPIKRANIRIVKMFRCKKCGKWFLPGIDRKELCKCRP